MAACPVPRDIMCGSCTLTLQRYQAKPAKERRKLLAAAKRIASKRQARR